MSYYNPYFAGSPYGKAAGVNTGNIDFSGGKYSTIQQDPHDVNNKYQVTWDPATGQAVRQNMGNGRGGAGGAVNPNDIFGADFIKQYGQAAPTALGNRNISGVGNVSLMQDPRTGVTYYSSGGKNFALNNEQMQGTGLPQIAGYDSSGNPYYKTAATGKEPTAEANALKEIQKTDPNSYNTIQNLSSYYKNQNDVLKGKLDPTAQNEVQQAARAAQVARGNYMGTAQATEEAFNTGQYGQNLRNSTAQNLQSYLNSGTTPQGMGSRHLSDIINQANSANAGTPFQSTYSPQNTYTYLNPNAGQQFAQGANNWYNGMNQQYGMGGSGGGLSPGMAAGAGALSGAVSGAAAGSVIPGVGTVIGGIGGALVGGAGGYFGSQRR